jgi:Nucleoside 2-deoxyribosyltransferase like
MSNTQHPRFIEAKAPTRIDVSNLASVFLAGSIEMGKALLWQDAMTKELSDLPVAVLNPRRSDWNTEWKQTEDFGPFRQQVDWEMDYLNDVDVIALYFQPNTMSPISLLELGLHAESGKVIVCCPEGFWRRGNVQIVCMRYNLEMVETMEELIAKTRQRLEKCVAEKEANA